MHILHGVACQVHGQAHGVLLGRAVLLKLETLFGQARLLGVAPRLGAGLANRLDGSEQAGLDGIAMLCPLRGQADADGEQGVASVSPRDARGETVGPACLAQGRKQATLSLMPEQVGNQVGRLVTVLGDGVVHRKEEAQLMAVTQGLHRDSPGKCLREGQRVADLRSHQASVGHRGEALGDQPLQFVEGLRGDDRQMHDIGTVVRCVEVDDPLAQTRLVAWTVGQSRAAADRKAGEGVLGIQQAVEHVIDPPALVTDARHIFGVHHVALALQAVGVEQRRDKELAEAIQGAFESVGLDGEEVVGVLWRGKGVVAAAMAGQIALVGVRLGVGLGAQKQHVLEEVGEPRQVCRILSAADRDIEGGRGLVGIGVADQQGGEAILQPQHAIFALIVRADSGCGAFLDGRSGGGCRLGGQGLGG